MGYDSKCHELAEHFLRGQPDDNEHNRQSLAQQIQNTVEDWFIASTISPASRVAASRPSQAPGGRDGE